MAGHSTVVPDTRAKRLVLLVAILICRPKAFDAAELDVMLCEARVPKVDDWLVNDVVKKNVHGLDLPNSRRRRAADEERVQIVRRRELA